jgi:tetratricopeptide (TPR) repeat protein
MAPMEAMALARDAADRALEVNTHLPEALTARACVRAVFDWDWKSAGQEFESAIRLNPQNAQAHQWYAMNCLAPVGEFQRASHQLNLAAELEPVSLAIATSRGILNFYQRDFEQAIGEFQSALVLDEGFYLAHYFLGLIYAQQRMYDESLRELERASEVTHGSPNTVAALGYKGALAGHRIEAQYALEVLSRQRKDRYVSPVLLAQLQAGLKDYDGALTSLEEAYHERATDLIWINLHPAFDSVRSDPRFMDLVYKVGLVKADQSMHQSLTRRPL